MMGKKKIFTQQKREKNRIQQTGKRKYKRNSGNKEVGRLTKRTGGGEGYNLFRYY